MQETIKILWLPEVPSLVSSRQRSRDAVDRPNVSISLNKTLIGYLLN